MELVSFLSETVSHAAYW